jgi:hypothetical protein
VFQCIANIYFSSLFLTLVIAKFSSEAGLAINALEAHPFLNSSKKKERKRRYRMKESKKEGKYKKSKIRQKERKKEIERLIGKERKKLKK